MRAVGGFAAAQRVANLSHLVEDAPADWRPRIVAALSDSTFHVWLSREPPRQLPVDAEGAAAAIEDYVRQQMPAQPGRDVRAAVFAPVGPPDAPFGPPFNQGPYAGPMGGMGGMRGMGSMMHQMMGPNFGVWRGLQVAVKLNDGQWLSFATTLPKGAPSVSWQFIISMVLMGVIVLVVSIWAVRRVTAPLGMLSGAADRLGRDVAAEPLAEAGTVEMQRAARAFNRMQERLRRLIESRTQMLAALSHDLRTPLTLLRLRTEEVADGEERDKMLATIAEMDEMIGSTLAFARDEVRAEPRRRVDIAALLESVVDDMADAGLPVSMTPAQPAIHECQPGALKRALTNLLDNAVKYGKRAQAALTSTAEAIEITIDDEGPGIPEAELAESVPAVLPGRGIAQPRHRRHRLRPRDRAGDRAGAWRRTHARQSPGRRLARDDQAAGLARPVSAFAVGDMLDQFDDVAAQLAVLDAHEGLDQRKPVDGGEKLGDIGRRDGLAHAAAMPARRRRALEEKRNRHLQDVAHLLQAAGADAVGALFVFLHLLEGQPERVAQPFLAHAQHHAAHAHARADIFVRWIGNFPWHRLFAGGRLSHKIEPCFNSISWRRCRGPPAPKRRRHPTGRDADKAAGDDVAQEMVIGADEADGDRRHRQRV